MRAWLALRLDGLAAVISHALPRRIVYQCFLRVAIEAANRPDRTSVVDLTVREAADRWEK